MIFTTSSSNISWESNCFKSIETQTLLLAALAKVFEQSPLLAAADSGEDSMVDVCARRDHRKAENRPKKAQDKIGALEHSSGS